MGEIFEPDDVDFVVAGGDSDPASVQETIEYIKEYKRRPEHAEEVRKAKEILESLKLRFSDYGVGDPESLLEHWKRYVADPMEADRIGQSVATQPDPNHAAS